MIESGGILLDRLNKKIEIQQKTNKEDGFGGFSEEWTKLKNTWAEIKPISAFEQFEAEKISEKVTHVITIRYFDTFKTDYRIKYYNRLFKIKGVINPEEKNNILEITVEEIL